MPLIYHPESESYFYDEFTSAIADNGCHIVTTPMRGRKQCDPVNGCGKIYNQHYNFCPHCKTPESFSNFLPFNPLDWIYDLESYPNIFTASFYHMASGARVSFEISDRINQLPELLEFLQSLRQTGCRLVGYNNVGYDYPIVHYIIEHQQFAIGYGDLYNKSMVIIDTPYERRFDNVIWDNETHIPQIDLYKIHHFDNDARRTSLKLLEFNMRMTSVEDLPFPPGTTLDDDQKNVLVDYNDHDVDATALFYIKSIELIEFRELLSRKYNRNFINHNDTKIGKDYFVMQLENQIPGSCYERVNGRKSPRQTWRPSINLGEVIFPYITFKEPEFERVKQWLAAQTITETKGIFTDLQAVVRGFTYVFGVGGIHGSIDSATVYSDDDYILKDWDVASYYPNLGIKNRLFPEHLSDAFCDIYQDVYEQRRGYDKGTPENAMLKLALNGVYGDSNNKYSPFYDPKYTMSITINGQLLLCMLAQYLIDIPGLDVIQINTDGLTVRCPRGQVQRMNDVCEWWQQYTCLELESATYARMFIRDVNNYIAQYDDGKVKRKGAYEYKLSWHQNHSALVIPMAAEAALVHGQDIREFIINHNDIHDFMLRTKINRSDSLITEHKIHGTQPLQRVTRYYISKTGGSLFKISPPAKGHKVGTWKRATKLTDQFYNGVINELLGQDHSWRLPQEIDSDGLPWDFRINTKNRSKYDIRRTGVNVGWLVTTCNNITTARHDDINFNYYIEEAHKLVDPLLKPALLNSDNGQIQ